MNWMQLKFFLPQILFYAFAFAALVQLFYYLFFFRRLAFFKNEKRTQSQEHPVSIIICARDEDENIARNLPGVLVQQYASTHEVVVVNDNSVDDSKYILQELKKTFKFLNVIDLTQEAKLISGKKYPLSIGIKEAKHEIVLLTDADCVPSSEYWLQKMQNGYFDGVDVVLGYGGYHKLPGVLNKLIRFETFHSALQYLSYAKAGVPYMGVGRNLSYKRDIFFRNKGFASINHIPSGDDDLFISKVANSHNTNVVLEPDAITLSSPKTTFTGWMKQKKRHYTTAKYYKVKHKFLLGLYTSTQFLFYPLLIAAFIVFDWRLVAGILAVKLVVQSLIYFKVMKRMNESDLWPVFILLDIWMLFYYIIFAPALWKKAAKTW